MEWHQFSLEKLPLLLAESKDPKPALLSLQEHTPGTWQCPARAQGPGVSGDTIPEPRREPQPAKKLWILQQLTPCNLKIPGGAAGWKAEGNQHGEASSKGISSSHKCHSVPSPLLRRDHPNGFHQTKAAPHHPQSCTTQSLTATESRGTAQRLKAGAQRPSSASTSHPAASQQLKQWINP